jgi:hypothetical protein
MGMIEIDPPSPQGSINKRDYIQTIRKTEKIRRTMKDGHDRNISSISSRIHKSERLHSDRKENKNSV